MHKFSTCHGKRNESTLWIFPSYFHDVWWVGFAPTYIDFWENRSSFLSFELPNDFIDPKPRIEDDVIYQNKLRKLFPDIFSYVWQAYIKKGSKDINKV
jgi:hypothetical protein